MLIGALRSAAEAEAGAEAEKDPRKIKGKLAVCVRV